MKRWTREAKSGCILDNRRTNMENDVNLSVTQWYRRLCPKLVWLASRAIDNENAFALIENMIEEYEKKRLKTLQQKMWLVINCPIKCHYVVVHKILILTNIWKIWLKEQKVLRKKKAARVENERKVGLRSKQKKG